MNLKTNLSILCSTFFLFSAGAFADGGKKEVWVYTSVYKEFIAPIEAEFEKKNPNIDVQVFQAGSEKIQAKYEAELISKKVQADILMISDPFYASDLGRRGLTAEQKKNTNYFSAMVMIAHKDLPAAKRPKSFADLTQPEFASIVQMGSPLESGTMFSTVAILDKRYGWNYFEGLKNNHINSSGGNSSVIQKVESGEKKVGVVLLENALAAQKRGSPIEIIYPTDGAVLIPSKLVILKSSAHPAEAAKFASFVQSKEGQELLRNGYMYSVRKDVSAPEGAISFKEIAKNPKEWSDSVIADISLRSQGLKKKFADTVLE